MKWHIVSIFILGTYFSINIVSLIFILSISILIRGICKGAIWGLELLEEVGWGLKRIFYPVTEEDMNRIQEEVIYNKYDFKIFITPDIEVLPVINFIDLEEQIQITSCK